jgi:hypothetical protein
LLNRIVAVQVSDTTAADSSSNADSINIDKNAMKSLGQHIYTIDNFLTEEECNHYIQLSEETGYDLATVETEKGPRVIDHVRNNHRVLYTNFQLAEDLWNRIKEFVPAKLGNSLAIGLNELFRFYKYDSGHRFKKHIDESYIRNENEASYFTLMIYLNNEYEGGETEFDAIKIKGKNGMALVFLHALPHEGVVVTKGIKYVLRTDVMYRLM